MLGRFIFQDKGVVLSVILAVLTLFSVSAFGAIENVDREFKFARGLIELGFSDYADEILDEIVRYHPKQKSRAKLVRVEILINLRKLSEAEVLAKTLPSSNPQALAAKLALANAYYVTGDRVRAQQIYKAFFKKYPPSSLKDPDLRRFYQDAAYKYGQMQELTGNIPEALKGYENVLKSNPDKRVTRHLKSEMAALYLKSAQEKKGAKRKKDIDRAKKLCDEVLMGGSDLWFARSINTLANIKMLKGDKKGAKRTLVKNMDIFKSVDKQLKEDGVSMDLSPVAAARFFLGKLYRDEAAALAKRGKKQAAVAAYAKALKQFVSVLAKYGGSEWSAPSGDYIDKIKMTLKEDFGKEIKIDLGRYQLSAIRARFDQANQLYLERKYDQALNEYLRAVNVYPECEESGKHLSRIGNCFARQGDKLAVEVVTDYICERYVSSPGAPIGLLTMAKYYFDEKDEEMYLKVYDAYLDTFPGHENAPGVLYRLAVIQKEAGNTNRANAFLQRLIKDYPDSAVFLSAVSRKAWDNYKAEDYENAVKNFRKYLTLVSVGPNKAAAQFSLADTLARQEKYDDACTEFEKLVKWLSPKDNAYSVSKEDVKKNRELLDKAEYYAAFCMSMRKVPKDQRENLSKDALARLDVFIAKHPKSPRTAMAYNTKGKVLLRMGRTDDAARVYSELALKYPDSDAGKGALYQLIRSSIEVGQTNTANKAFAKMTKNAGAYSPVQFVLTGNMMLEKGLFESAAKAYSQALKKTIDSGLLERALFGLGKAQFERGKYTESAEALERLMKENSTSAFFYDAKFILSRSLLAAGETGAAREALRDVFKFSKDPVLLKQADYQLALIHRAAGNSKQALGAFYRIILSISPDTKDEILRGLLEKSLFESIELYVELGRNEDVVETCSQYLHDFPKGERVNAVRDIRKKAKLQ